MRDEDDWNGELRDIELFVDGLPSSGDENAVDINRQLGLQPDQVNDYLLHNEGLGSDQFSVKESATQDFSSRDDFRSSTKVTNEMNQEIHKVMHRASDLLMAVSVTADTNRQRVIDLAASALDELTKMAVAREPLWCRKGNGTDMETLNGVEYMKGFGSVDATLQQIMKMVEVEASICLPTLDCSNISTQFGVENAPMLEEHLHSEGSKHIGLVRMHPIRIVDLLMDVNRWSSTFSNLISNATLLGILSTGENGSYNGRLQVMNVEFLLPTVLVPTRESYFARYCRQIAYGLWAVVDVSLETLFPHQRVRFRRRPSGCLIQEMPNGCSQVVWIEHVAADNRSVHSMYQPLVYSGFAFSAKRWVAAIIRHCEWLLTLGAENIPTHDNVKLPQSISRESILKFAEKTWRSFWRTISVSKGNMWTPIPLNGAEDVRVMHCGTVHVPGKPPSTRIAFTTSFWLPIPPRKVFNFLRDPDTRTKWDTRLYGHVVRELFYVINGGNPENRVSLLQVNTMEDKISIFYLQESHTDDTASYVIYTPVDALTLSTVFAGGSTDRVHIMPCGFAILPDRPTWQGSDACGSLITFQVHVIDDAVVNNFIPTESLKVICKVIADTICLIKKAVLSCKYLPNY